MYECTVAVVMLFMYQLTFAMSMITHSGVCRIQYLQSVTQQEFLCLFCVLKKTSTNNSGCVYEHAHFQPKHDPLHSWIVTCPYVTMTDTIMP